MMRMTLPVAIGVYVVWHALVLVDVWEKVRTEFRVQRRWQASGRKLGAD